MRVGAFRLRSHHSAVRASASLALTAIARGPSRDRRGLDEVRADALEGARVGPLLDKRDARACPAEPIAVAQPARLAPTTTAS